MKQLFVFIIVISLILFGSIIRGNWIVLLKLLCGLFLIVLMLYWKIAPFKGQLFPKYQRAFGIIENIFVKTLGVIKFIPKAQIGQHLQLDTSIMFYIIVISLVLIIL